MTSEGQGDGLVVMFYALVSIGIGYAAAGIGWAAFWRSLVWPIFLGARIAHLLFDGLK